MMIAEQRRTIQHLLDERQPADAMADYFAFYYPESKTTLRPYPADSARADGYVCFSRTGVDLFRPFVTMRLPIEDIQAAADMLYKMLEPEMPVILNAPANYGPLLNALLDVQTEDHLSLFILRATHFEPILNVLITQDEGANGYPRFVIRDRKKGDLLVASAGLNWQTAHFAEISVTTHPKYRRQGYGRSVVAAMANYLLKNGRAPLYVASQQNYASIQLAQRLGFTDTFTRHLMIQGHLKPRQDLGK